MLNTSQAQAAIRQARKPCTAATIPAASRPRLSRLQPCQLRHGLEHAQPYDTTGKGYPRSRQARHGCQAGQHAARALSHAARLVREAVLRAQRGHARRDRAQAVPRQRREQVVLHLVVQPACGARARGCHWVAGNHACSVGVFAASRGPTWLIQQPCTCMRLISDAPADDYPSQRGLDWMARCVTPGLGCAPVNQSVHGVDRMSRVDTTCNASIPGQEGIT